MARVGLGGLFLAWMAWSYGLLTPVSVPDGANAVTPADVDEVTSRRYAQDLKAAIDRTEVPPAPADKAEILKSGDIGAVPAPTLAGLSALAFDSQTAEVKKLVNEDDTKGRVAITQLPAVSPSTVTEALSKRATIDPAVQNVAGQPPVPAAQAAAQAPAAATASRSGRSWSTSTTFGSATRSTPPRSRNHSRP